ncbi:phage portal protein [Pseudoroseicyclus sp. CXY001]|uniref:phage portal protein n=1 Tax=Pseudoroseicyclus sp. CXY001 TaxID=3242492 RepID=UPI003570A24C
MNIFDRVIASVAPEKGLRRARARRAMDVVMRYEAAETQSRNGSWRPVRGDADAAARGARTRLAAISYDMIRNTPLGTRGQQVIANNVIADGIIPKILTADDKLRGEVLSFIEAHLDTNAIDADGRTTLYGMQRLAINTVVAAGEVLLRRRRRLPTDGLPLPFQIQVLEPDFLDVTRDGPTKAGTTIREGIEFDAIGRRIAYWLYDEHPGARGWRGLRQVSRRVPASEIIHIYRQDRPGQMRGVSWFAPVALTLQDLDDHQDAQLMRQKIAACFVAFRTRADDEPVATENPGGLKTLSPGRIDLLGAGEDIKFAEPPGVGGYDQFTTAVIQMVAAGLGITYEALSGDLNRTNWTSYKAGRIEMNRAVSGWQWHMMVPAMQQIGAWFVEAWQLQTRRIGSKPPVSLSWVPPRPALIDPEKEVRGQLYKLRAGLGSRQAAIRELGFDPERVMEEVIADNELADGKGLIFDSDPRKVAISGVLQRPADNSDGASNVRE